jgi:hypothetical protein
MPHINERGVAVAAVLLFATVARDSSAQARDTSFQGAEMRTIAPGPQYRADALQRVLLGSGWRDVWVTHAEVPVLDPATFAGGLKFDKRGGFKQSVTAHWKEENGSREWVFRSVDKFPTQAVSEEIKGTLVGRIIEDQISALFPGAPLMVPPLLQSIGALHVQPTLVVMKDSPRLEKERETFAGMLGTFELKANEGPEDSPGFAGSKKIQDSDDFLKKLDEDHSNRLDEREFLATRLIDFLINDTDRTPDNFMWARFGEKGNYTWRPIPRDRDWAFIDSRGIVASLVVNRVFPKFTGFKPRYSMRALLYSGHHLDRRLLQRLNAQDFWEVAQRVQLAVTDPVIERAVDQLPESWQSEATTELKAVMRARRDNLLAAAMRFYMNLASDVDVHGTDLAEYADIVRHTDGRVTVTVSAIQAPSVAVERRVNDRIVTTTDGAIELPRDVWFRRTFNPTETNEVRIYLGKGNDVATIRGERNSAITVRVIGEGGDDKLTDNVGAGGAHLYDSEGENQFGVGGKTRVVTKPWDAPEPTAGLRLGEAWRPDWGGKRGFGAAVDYETGAGVVIGAGPRLKRYGFRRLPFHWTAGANFLYGTGNGRMGVTGDIDYRTENSPVAYTLAAQATQLEATRFFGYGNDTPQMSSRDALVNQRVLAIEPSFVYRIGWRTREQAGNLVNRSDSGSTGGLRPLTGKLIAGPRLSWIDPDPRSDALLATSGVTGARGFSLVGAQVAVELDRTDDSAVPTMGWRLKASTAAYPVTNGIDGAFGTLGGSASAYVPIAGGLHAAVRAGGAVAEGDVPVQFAPALGGRSSLRGYSWRRFAGDRSAFAGAELRQPVGTVNFILKSQLGLFALADAGRVWFAGTDGGGIHTSVGGGFWLSALGKSVSVAYAKGEADRIYLKYGLSY